MILNINNTHEELVSESLERIQNISKGEIFYCKDLFTKEELESISTRVKQISHALWHDIDTTEYGYKALGKRKNIALYQRL